LIFNILCKKKTRLPLGKWNRDW